MTTPEIHSLRQDLPAHIASALIDAPVVVVYGPDSTAVKVWNAIDKAAAYVGVTVTTEHRDGKWIITTQPWTPEA